MLVHRMLYNDGELHCVMVISYCVRVLVPPFPFPLIHYILDSEIAMYAISRLALGLLSIFGVSSVHGLPDGNNHKRGELSF